MGEVLEASVVEGEWARILGDPQHLTIDVRFRCQRCQEWFALGGPVEHQECPHCSFENFIDRLTSILVLASNRIPASAPMYDHQVLSSPRVSCHACGELLSVEGLILQTGVTGTVPCSCGAAVPTYPAPPWLASKLLGARQIFGGDPSTAALLTGVDAFVEVPAGGYRRNVARRLDRLTWTLTYDHHLSKGSGPPVARRIAARLDPRTLVKVRDLRVAGRVLVWGISGLLVGAHVIAVTTAVASGETPVFLHVYHGIEALVTTLIPVSIVGVTGLEDERFGKLVLAIWFLVASALLGGLSYWLVHVVAAR
jgi:hypothetical protein